MKKYCLSFLTVLLLSTSFIKAQEIELGTSPFKTERGSGFFDYSDPTTLNIKVSVWGYIKYPGKYQIPIYLTPADILSFAGGPLDGAELDNIRLYRVRDDGTEEIIKLNYEDIVYENQLNKKNRPIPTLKNNDILIVPGGPKYYFRDWLGITLSIFSALVSLAILIIRY